MRTALDTQLPVEIEATPECAIQVVLEIIRHESVEAIA